MATFGVTRTDNDGDVVIHKNMTESAALKAIEVYNSTAEVACNSYVYVLTIYIVKPTA